MVTDGRSIETATGEVLHRPTWPITRHDPGHLLRLVTIDRQAVDLPRTIALSTDETSKGIQDEERTATKGGRSLVVVAAAAA